MSNRECDLLGDRLLCYALILQGLPDRSETKRGWCGLITMASRFRVGSLTKSPSETAVCFCSQSSNVNLSKAVVSLLLTSDHARRSSLAESGSASTLSAFAIYGSNSKVKSIPETEQGKPAIVHRVAVKPLRGELTPGRFAKNHMDA